MAPLIKIKIGDIDEYIEFYPDLANSYTFIPEYTFTGKLDIPPKNISIKIKEHYYNCTQFFSLFTENYSNIHFTNYTYYSYEYYFRTLPLLPFSFKVEESSSIVYQSYYNGLINSLSFSVFRNKTGNQYIYLGGIPAQYKKYKTGRCNVITKYDAWGCKLHSILFMDYEYIGEEYIGFDFKWDQFYVSKRFFDFFNNTMRKINRDINKNKETFFDMKLIMDDYILIIKNTIKRKNDGDLYLFPYISYTGYFMLGLPFFSAFIIHFDYEKKKITMVSMNDRETYITVKYSFRNYYVIFNIIFLLLNIVYLIVLKFNSNIYSYK